MILPMLSEIDVVNYGTILQSYALQKVLTEMGYDVEIINYSHKELFRQISRLFNFTLLKAKWKSIRKNYAVKKDKEFSDYNKKKNQAFYSFKAQSFLLSKKLLNRKELVQYAAEKNMIILGSDQVWNPVNLGKDYFTMTFVPDYVKKLTYAPSFGVRFIPVSQREKTKRYLERIDFLSVRELSGAKIIKELTDRDAKVVVDPTLLLTKDMWEQEERKIEGLPNHYIFCYFLGNAQKNRRFANKLKELTGYQIVHLPFMDEFVKDDKTFGDMIPMNVGPREFLYLIHNAAYVCTDSFHGTVFSLHFHKKLYALSRTSSEGKISTSNRIMELLRLVHLEERFVRVKRDEDIEKILKRRDALNWDIVDNYIESRRDESRRYLIRSLEEACNGYHR